MESFPLPESTFVPPDASAWMAQVLIQEWESKGIPWEEQHGNEARLLAKLKDLSGMTRLLKKDLECIWKEMEQLAVFDAKRSDLKSPKGEKKCDMAVYIRRFFFSLNGFGVDEAAMRLLDHQTKQMVLRRARIRYQQQQQQHQTQHLPSYAPVPTRIACPGPGRKNQMGSPAAGMAYWKYLASLSANSNMTQAVPAPFAMSLDAAAAQNDSPTHSNSPFHRLSGNAKSSPKQGTKQPAKRPPPSSWDHSNIAQPSSWDHSNIAQHQVTKVKQELEPVEDESVPHNDEEVRLLRELEAMGFTNKQEILDSIRRVKFKNTYQPLDSDTIMLDLITQREEVDEARRMDQARLESERLRKEDAAQRRKAITEEKELKLKTASLTEWKSNDDYFPHSWVLANAFVVKNLEDAAAQPGSDAKDQLLSLLKLERDSRKWYKNDLPRAYFSVVVNNNILANPGPRAVRDFLEKEVARLGHALWSREEQQGSVPRLFIEAHDKHASALVGQTNGNDDDDVVVIVTPGSITAKAKECTQTKPKSLRHCGMSPPKKRQRNTPLSAKNTLSHPVIEILD